MIAGRTGNLILALRRNGRWMGRVGGVGHFFFYFSVSHFRFGGNIFPWTSTAEYITNKEEKLIMNDDKPRESSAA